MTAEVRAKCELSDDQVVFLFKQLWTRRVPIAQIAFSKLSMRELRLAYTDPDSTIIEEDVRQALPVLVIDNAICDSGARKTLLAIDYGACRLFTIL